MILWILAGLLVFLMLSRSQEHMTNADLISTLKTFGTKKETPPNSSTTPTEAPIFGPRTSKLEHPKPTNKPNSANGSGVYPDIYGPEYVGVPGSSKPGGKPGEKPGGKPSSHENGKHSSDGSRDDDAYQFNPDLQKAFPTNGPPQPFLTDFSKFQH